MRIITIFILAISIHVLHATENNHKNLSLLEKLRPTLNAWLGTNRTEALIGKAPFFDRDDAVSMPIIPTVVSNAKSVEVYNKKADKILLGLEIEQKYFVAFIKEVFSVTRKQNPNEDELQKLYNVLSQGGTREGVYRSLVLDNTYASLENLEGNAVKKEAAEFAVFFYQKYINKKLKIEQFKGWSTYSLKRELTEKALDIIDSFGDNRDGIEAWYGNLSSDLAFKHQTAMTNSLRKNTSSEFHRDWAKKVPIQHIKSEVIIKIHLAFNALM